MLLTETRVCMVESTGAMYARLACAYSPAHLHINYTTYGGGTAPAPRRGGHPGKTGLGDESCLWPVLSVGRHGVPISPPKWARSAARPQLGGQRFSLGCGAGSWRGTRTEVQPSWEGSSHRPLLFRHEFLSWHGCPQALYICLIPISLLSFKSTSLSGVITGQFSPHAKFRYCIYYLHVDLGDIVSQFPVR